MGTLAEDHDERQSGRGLNSQGKSPLKIKSKFISGHVNRELGPQP